MAALYEPKHQPQLTGIATAGSDCGPRATSMAIDDATEGAVVPSVTTVRKRMQDLTGATNTVAWDRCIDSYDTKKELAGKFERLRGTRLTSGTWQQVRDHLSAGKGVILALDYGLLRKLAPGKVGSTTFSEGHAIFLKHRRRNSDGIAIIKDWDPLNDGRRRGIPKGPVWVQEDKLRRAAEEYGRQNGGGVFAVLVHAQPVKPVVEPPPPVVVEPGDVTLASILGDLYDLRTAGHAELAPIISDLEGLIGPYTGPAKPTDEPSSGLK